MATIDLTVPLSLSETIGSLMHAIIEAQAQSAQSTVEFIQEVGLEEETKEGEAAALRQVKFKYKKLDENAKVSEYILDVPLLSLVEIPLINIKTAKLSFKYDVTSTTSSTTKSSNARAVAALPVKGIFKKRPAKLKGKVHRTSRTDSQQKGGLNVEIELEKSDWPVGIERLYDILELSSASQPAEEDGGE